MKRNSGYIIYSLFIFWISQSYASEEKDNLKCKQYLNDADLSVNYHIKMIEHMTLFSHNVLNEILEDMRTEYGNDVKGLGIITSHFNYELQLAIRMVTPKFLKSECTKNPDASLERLGRALIVAVQNLTKVKPELQLEIQIRKLYQ